MPAQDGCTHKQELTVWIDGSGIRLVGSTKLIAIVLSAERYREMYLPLTSFLGLSDPSRTLVPTTCRHKATRHCLKDTGLADSSSF